MNILQKSLLKLIKLYQLTPTNWHYMCRHYPTCSTYTYQAIEEYGAIRGSLLGIKRIITCNPLNKKIYDPLIRKEPKK